MSARALPACALVALAAACGRGAGAPPPFTAAVTLGGRSIAPGALEHGRDVYTHFCRPCHGDAGDGKGPAAPGLRPPPRDLRLGVYKFAAVAAGQLPRDEDFVRTLRQGLHGTAMLSWDVPPAEVDNLIQYVKAFAPRWRNEKPGDAIVATPDPWTGREADSVERGRRVYHGLAQCATACHPAYVTKPEIAALTKELTKMDVREVRADIYYAVAAGIGGTAMPTWKNVLPDPDIWAMAHYVRSLVAMRGTPQAAALQRSLLAQPAWSPPPP
jgi:mono/diheme cytochrome c family protein